MGRLTAAVLSLLILGLGQVYCGKLLRGVAWFVIGGLLIVGAAAVAGPYFSCDTCLCGMYGRCVSHQGRTGIVIDKLICPKSNSYYTDEFYVISEPYDPKTTLCTEISAIAEIKPIGGNFIIRWSDHNKNYFLHFDGGDRFS